MAYDRSDCEHSLCNAHPGRELTYAQEEEKQSWAGDLESPPPERIPWQRGRVKKTKSRNLLERLKDFTTETLRFMREREVPFTNNQGENDLRMTQVQQKVSGCFRSLEGAQIFARIRSYINTCRKNDVRPTEALTLLFQGRLPEFITL